MPYINLHGMRYYFERHGLGAPILLLHGFTGSTENWQQQIAVLKKQFTVIVIDLLGHGRSAKPKTPERYAMPLEARDVAAFIEQQSFSGDVRLLGYSMGGRLALYVALYYPQLIHTLILESSSPGIADAHERSLRRQRDNALADRIEREGIPSFVNYWEELSLFDTQHSLPEAARQALRQQRLKNSASGLANSLRGMGTGVQPSLWGELSHLEIPAMYIVGAQDSKFLHIAEEMRQSVPHGTLHVVAGAGHTVHLEQPDQFNAILLAS